MRAADDIVGRNAATVERAGTSSAREESELIVLSRLLAAFAVHMCPEGDLAPVP